MGCLNALLRLPSTRALWSLGKAQHTALAALVTELR